MSGVAEASLVLGIISSIISIVTAAKEICQTANNASSLPKAFDSVTDKLPIVLVILKEAKEYVERPDVDQETRNALQRVLGRCEASANELHEIFKKAIPKEGASRFDRYWFAARTLGKGGRVEELIKDILKEVSLLSVSFSFSSQRRLEEALGDGMIVRASLPEHNSGFSRVKTLKEIKYQNNQLRLKSSQTQDLKDFFSNWLLPERLPAPYSDTEHTFHLEKRFRNPETGYTTYDWFFETAEYSKFIDPEIASVLRIKGSTGCGKSVLSSAIIDRIQNFDQVKPSLILYCYGHRDPERTSSLTLVRGLVAQVLRCETPEIMDEFKKFHSSHQTLKEHDTKVEEELWSLLRTVLALKTGKVYIVVDGLDECAQPLICVRSLIKVSTALSSTNKCSLLLSSRLERRDVFDNKNIQAALKKGLVKLSQLELTPELTSQDMKEFVAYQVTTHSSFLSTSQKIRDKIINGVCERANGMFLYASLVLEDLTGDKISSMSAIDKTLANLPRDLFNSYEQKIETARHSIKGREVFSWIFCANPALSWHELKSALAIGASGYDEDENVLVSCEEFIEHSCGQLVECFGASEHLRFIQPTVKDFLVDRNGLDDDLGISTAYSMVASKLLTFLEYSDLPSFSSPDIENPEEIIKTYSLSTGRGLYCFATFNWYKHLKMCDKSEDASLEEQVLKFLMSPFFIRWLKGAIIISRALATGLDSVSLTTDIIDSLQGWMMGRTWSNSDSEYALQAWIKNFLDLMLDWGKVLEIQPDWMHYLHHQLLSEDNYFRGILETDGDDSIIQFYTKTVRTKSSEAVTWPNRCFAMDAKNDLAFTYDEPFVSCYHIKTGLLTAEIPIHIPSKILGPLEVRRGVLCPQGKYLAVIFEAMGPSLDPVGAQIRTGRNLILNFSTTAFAWSLENAAADLYLTGVLAHMAIGIDYAEFVVCLLELQHEGPARTHLFRLPSWATSPILTTGTETMRWELDDVDVLQFSEDSSRLATPFGIFDLESGGREKPWSFSLQHFYQGGKLSSDFKTFATILRHIEGGCIIQMHDVGNSVASCRETKFEGIVHLLTMSSSGRFLLLLRREVVKEKKKANKENSRLPPQEGLIGIWDCRDKEWTPLLLLDQTWSQRLPLWNLLPYRFPPSFGSEAIEFNDINRVLLYVPPRWKLAGNVRHIKAFNTGEAHLLLFETKKSTKGFGKHPFLKLQLPAAALRAENAFSAPALTFLSWSVQFDTATIYYDLSVMLMAHEEMKEAAMAVVKSRKEITECDALDQSRESQRFSALILTPTASAAFFIQIIIIPSMDDGQTFMEIDQASWRAISKHQSVNYEFSVTCLMAGENQATSSAVKHVALPDICYPSMDSQPLCVATENSMSLGCIEMDIDYEYEDMTITIGNPREAVFQRALKSFKTRSRPLEGPNSESTVVGFVETHPIVRYAIFDPVEVSFNSFDGSAGKTTESFTIKGEASAQEDLHIFQFSRCVKNLSKNRDREARQFEIFLCAYDAAKDDISWMVHTTTGGDISCSRESFPETAWALHPKLPLLAWIIPGHRLRISNVETEESPISIAESLTLEVDPTQAIKFSPSGQYIAVQGREAFRNDFLSLRRSEGSSSVMLCDLVKGKTIGATLASASKISIELRDESMHIYRLTRDGAIESSVYTLPDLVLSKRQYLTFIPAHCSCSTCGNSFDSEGIVSIMEYQDVQSVIVGHTPMNVGRASINTIACEPLIIRITSPPVELDITDIQDALLIVNSSRSFPKILDDQGDMLNDAFADIRRACIMESGVECSCAFCSAEDAPDSASSKFARIAQMRNTMSNFQFESGLPIQPEEVEKLHRAAQAHLKKTLSFKDKEFDGTNSAVKLKELLGEELFPWDNWEEFSDAMEEIKEEFDHKAYMRTLFESGNCGVGCNIPLFVHTFAFHDKNEEDFHWSCATTTGWIEEDIEWFYERFFGGSFEGARRWYEFPAYEALSVRYEALKADTTSKGKRFRKYFGEQDKKEKVLEIELPEKQETVKKEKNTFEADGIEFENELKPLLPGLVVKDIFNAMSDLVPGLGKVFEVRLHNMLNQSLISDMVD